MIYRFHRIPIKISAGFYVDIEKLIINFTGKDKETTKAKTILKESKVEGFLLLDF